MGLPLAALILTVLASPGATRVSAAEIVVDCSKTVGRIRPLHGVNNGPLDLGGTVDLSVHHKELTIPFTRLHDAHWPNPDVVDMHAVFPNPDADPGRPESYDFARTDEYVRAITATGSRIVYRLGESIEHTPKKYRVHPPKSAEKWAAACVGIVRHYNDGWANGFRHDVRYWEIWNEPDNRPAQWTGTDEQYFRLYAAAARAIKRRYPDLKVGGPAIGNTGKMEGDTLDAPPFLKAFLEFCKRESVPLDFFSWHMYTADPRALAAQARGVRALLDRHGFEKTESHLNEWNYLPDNDWTPVLLPGQGPPRERFYDRVGGAEGAAFSAASLMLLQDSPVDVANYYAGDTNPFGLFTRHGTPRKTFYAFKAFKMLTDTPVRVRVDSVEEARGVHAVAGMSEDREAVTVLVSHFNAADALLQLRMKQLPWGNAADYEVFVVDAVHDLNRVSRGTAAGGDAIAVEAVKPHSVYVLRLQRAK
jgi:hypothetical protein